MSYWKMIMSLKNMKLGMFTLQLISLESLTITLLMIRRKTRNWTIVFLTHILIFAMNFQSAMSLLIQGNGLFKI